MTTLLSTMKIGSLISILYSIVVFTILYITIYKYGYVSNVVVYALSRTIPLFIFMNPKNFEILWIFLLYIISGLFVVFIATLIREWFEYETIVWYIFLLVIIESITLLIFGAFLKLFI